MYLSNMGYVPALRWAETHILMHEARADALARIARTQAEAGLIAAATAKADLIEYPAIRYGVYLAIARAAAAANHGPDAAKQFIAQRYSHDAKLVAYVGAAEGMAPLSSDGIASVDLFSE